MSRIVNGSLKKKNQLLYQRNAVSKEIFKAWKHIQWTRLESSSNFNSSIVVLLQNNKIIIYIWDKGSKEVKQERILSHPLKLTIFSSKKLIQASHEAIPLIPTAVLLPRDFSPPL